MMSFFLMLMSIAFVAIVAILLSIYTPHIVSWVSDRMMRKGKRR